MNKKVLIAGLVLVLPLIALFAMSFGNDPHSVRSPLVGRQAPPFALTSVGEKQTVSLDALKGKPAVVNFWATWCQPCKMEHGVLTRGANAFGEQVQFVGVVYDDKEEAITEFLDRYGSGYPALIDEGGKTAIAYGVTGVPETFFIDANGKIVSKYAGPLSPDLLAKHVRELLEAQ
ncbi:TlpA family protein disulfide reductase [Vulgatibacter sp.]|uniref:TlpA family protein disulfide reductase n=1 Tax=Vulgatibacter sp. TaxID=1971226 RepID=UPI00356A5413